MSTDTEQTRPTKTGQKTIRHVRTGDEWVAASERAEREGETISAVVRALLRKYARGEVDI